MLSNTAQNCLSNAENIELFHWHQKELLNGSFGWNSFVRNQSYGKAYNKLHRIRMELRIWWLSLGGGWNILPFYLDFRSISEMIFAERRVGTPSNILEAVKAGGLTLK